MLSRLSSIIFYFGVSFLAAGSAYSVAATPATVSYSYATTQLQADIDRAGGKWVAGDTPISALSPTEQKVLLGFLPPADVEIRQAKILALSVPPLGLPASLDWRNYNGNNWVSPVKNQGSCGSCWAFATTAALESANMIASNSTATVLDQSEQTVLSCSQAGSCAGGYIHTASTFLGSTGSPVETCFPYVARNDSCSLACGSYPAQTKKVTSWTWVATNAPTVAELKAALFNYGPLVTSMQVYSDFFSYTSGIYSQASGTYQGGHAIVIIGYDDAGQYFIVKNSWGTSWGESGYFRIAYSQLNNVVQFGYYTISYIAPASATPPGQAVLVSPSGTIASATPTYTWNADPAATQYYLWVDDPTTGTTGKIKTWYTAAQAGCGAGTGTCSVTPATVLAAGAGKWYIQTWNAAGYGPWSAVMNFSVNLVSTPGQATLVSPTGAINTAAPTYTWNAVSNAAQYYLWVDDSTSGATGKIKTWYTAAQAGCGAGTGTCSITPATALAAGSGKWYVQTWNSSGYGPWSAAMGFSIPATAPAGAPLLLSPAGGITTNTPAYSWSAVPGVTWYYLWVDDSTSGVNGKIKTWYTAAQAGCAAGAGTCSVTPATFVEPGAAKWYVQTYTNVNGPWSAPLNFTVQPSTGFSDTFSGASSPNWFQDSGVWAESFGAFNSTGVTLATSFATYKANFTGFDYSARLWRDGCLTCSNRLAIRASGQILATGHFSNEYIFQYTADGYYSVWKFINGTSTPLQSWTTSGAINLNAAWNDLRVIATGSSFYYLINNVLVWSGTDPDLTSGRSGFGFYVDDISTGNHLWTDSATLIPSGTMPALGAISAQQQIYNANPLIGGTVDMQP